MKTARNFVNGNTLACFGKSFQELIMLSKNVMIENAGKCQSIKFRLEETGPYKLKLLRVEINKKPLVQLSDFKK